EARGLDGEDEAVGHSIAPLGEARRRLGAVERAVDLDRGQVSPGMFKLARMRQAGRVEAAAPGLIGPAADADMDMARMHAIDRPADRYDVPFMFRDVAESSAPAREAGRAPRQRQRTSPLSTEAPTAAPPAAPITVPSVLEPPGAIRLPSTPPA